MTTPRPAGPWTTARRWLRSPATITGEVLGAAAIGVVRATVPQAADVAASSQLAEDWPRLARLVHVAWLDRIVTSPWAVVVFGLSALSLGIVFVEVTEKAVRRWRTPPAERSFASAPFQAEVERSAGGPVAATTSVRGRLGLVGVPLLHAGILLLIVAGLLRALLGADAVAWVMQGETLEAGTRSITAVETGLLASPLSLAEPVRLEDVELFRRPDGSVEREEARLGLGTPPRSVPIAINAAVHVGSARLYLSQRHGPALLAEIGSGDDAERRAILLSADGAGYSGQDVMGNGTVLRVHGRLPAGTLGGLEAVDVRVMKGPTLLHAGRARVGETVTWPGGQVAFRASVPWVEIRMTSDPSTAFAWLGVILVLAGVTLFALITPVDVLVRPARDAPGGERVRIAMRPHRFAALHEQSFQELVDRVREGKDG